MRLPLILAVAGREILATLRDHRAVFANLLIPLLVLPLVILGLPLLVGGLFGREAVTQSEIGAEGLERLPTALIETFRRENIRLVPVADAAAAVRSERVAGALEVPADFRARLESGSTTLTFYRKSGGLRDELIGEKLTGAVQAFEQTVVRGRVARAGLPPSLLTPITLDTRDASSAAERASGSLSWLIPFFIVIWTLLGGQMVAIDATAGEKERGTLEALLVTPVRRSEVVLGKFLATLLFGLSTSALALVGFVISGGLLRGLVVGRLNGQAGELAQGLGGSLGVQGWAALALVGSSLLLAALVAALLLAITMFARSFKEAQSYVAPLSFILVLPVVALQFADFFGQSPVLYALPAFGTLLLMNDLAQGTFALQAALLAWGSSLLFAALLLAFALRNFQREDVLFRT